MGCLVEMLGCPVRCAKLFLPLRMEQTFKKATRRLEERHRVITYQSLDTGCSARQLYATQGVLRHLTEIQEIVPLDEFYVPSPAMGVSYRSRLRVRQKNCCLRNNPEELKCQRTCELDTKLAY